MAQADAPPGRLKYLLQQRKYRPAPLACAGALASICPQWPRSRTYELWRVRGNRLVRGIGG
jgi:hypothetical protein